MFQVSPYVRLIAPDDAAQLLMVTMFLQRGLDFAVRDRQIMILSSDIALAKAILHHTSIKWRTNDNSN